MINIKTSYITKGGLFAALGFLFIYLSTIIPNSKFFLLGAASCIIPLTIITTNLKTSLIVYVATTFLCILIGFRFSVIAYILFFGPYGIIKLFIEKINNITLEIILKLIFFNIIAFIIYFISKSFITIPKGTYLFTIGCIILQFVFLFYDYIITLFVHYVRNKTNIT